MSKNKATDIPAPTLLQFYKNMLFYRRFEERVNLAYTQQKFSGFCHLHIGQEAVCVGVQSCLSSKDYMLSSYRSHTQAIAKGIAAEAVFSELLGKVSGCSGGKGGSMHMFGKEQRFFGGQGIVGAQAPVATGVAFSSKYRKQKHVTVCYLGDAAMNQGAVFEALNMAATWQLPVFFIIENNQYGMGTDIKRTTSVDKLSKRALAFDMEFSEVDGMDVIKVHNHCQSIVESMRTTNKPHLLEAHTYRYKGHSVSDPGTYRSKEEVQSYLDKDPIVILGKKLIKENLCTQKDLDDWNKNIKEQVKKIEKKAEASPEPDLSDAWKHVFSD